MRSASRLLLLLRWCASRIRDELKKETLHVFHQHGSNVTTAPMIPCYKLYLLNSAEEFGER